MASAELVVEVVYSPEAGSMRQVALRLPEGSTVADALRMACPDLSMEGLALGVWGKLRAPSDVLRDRDRVELYRALRVDPKEARRQRHQSQRATRVRR